MQKMQFFIKSFMCVWMCIFTANSLCMVRQKGNLNYAQISTLKNGNLSELETMIKQTNTVDMLEAIQAYLENQVSKAAAVPDKEDGAARSKVKRLLFACQNKRLELQNESETVTSAAAATTNNVMPAVALSRAHDTSYDLRERVRLQREDEDRVRARIANSPTLRALNSDSDEDDEKAAHKIASHDPLLKERQNNRRRSIAGTPNSLSTNSNSLGVSTPTNSNSHTSTLSAAATRVDTPIALAPSTSNGSLSSNSVTTQSDSSQSEGESRKRRGSEELGEGSDSDNDNDGFKTPSEQINALQNVTVTAVPAGNSVQSNTVSLVSTDEFNKISNVQTNTSDHESVGISSVAAQEQQKIDVSAQQKSFQGEYIVSDDEDDAASAKKRTISRSMLLKCIIAVSIPFAVYYAIKYQDSWPIATMMMAFKNFFSTLPSFRSVSVSSAASVTRT